MKTVKFQPNLAQLIIDGKKKTTWRLFDDKDLQVGDAIELMNKATGEIFGRAVVSTVVEKPIKDLDDADWEGHERFPSEEAMYAAYRGYYPGQEVGPDTMVKILHFVLIKKIKAAIFDLNGIFLQSQKLSVRFAEDFGVSKEVFMPKLSEIMGRVRQPNAGNAFEYWSPVLKEWNVNLSEQEFWDYWFKAEVQSEFMIKFARELRSKGIKVFILSNNFKERAEYYGHYPWIHDAVDKVYFSWQTGFVKPDPRAWELVLRENDLKPEECIYFDDQDKNISAAESVGIASFRFTDEAGLEKIVRGLI